MEGAPLEELCCLLGERVPELTPSGELFDLGQKLLVEQRELARLYLSPYQDREWVKNKIYPKWEKLLSATNLWSGAEVRPLLGRLENALLTGMSFDPSNKIDGLPADLLDRWSKLAYVQITSTNLSQLDEVIRLVEEPVLPIFHKEQMLKVLKSLRAIVYTIPEVEEKATSILQSLRFGNRSEDQDEFGPDELDFDFNGEFGASLAD